MYVVACIHRKYYYNFCEGLNIEDAGLQTGQKKKQKNRCFHSYACYWRALTVNMSNNFTSLLA